ncbi:TPA: hypothetical protein DCW61_01795 [Candidatus Uhrbacteria bacterium]|nr:hypothetical protein [Candidatus Uhrbacteria bacterium]
METLSQEFKEDLSQDGDRGLYFFREPIVTEIPQINRLLVEEYGESYPYPVGAFDPTGIYLIAVYKPTQEIVGFSRASPYGGHTGVHELGGLIVTRPHRGRGLAKKMTLIRLEICRSQGAKIAISEPVCYRVDCASQHNLLKHFNFVLLGIQPAKYPDIQHEILQGQPESVLMAASWLEGESGFGTRRIFLPEEYRGLPYTYLPSEIHSKHFRQHIKADSFPEMIHHPSRLGRFSVGAEYIDVPANWHRSAVCIGELIHEGYHFSCLLPAFGVLPSGGYFDYVRLYRFPDKLHGFDFRRVHVAPQLAPLKYFCAGELACRR